MAERQVDNKKTGTREAESPPLTAAQFETSPEFRRFRTGMKQLLKVSKAELDRRVAAEKIASTRIGNPKSPGRKPNFPA
jgi:hypothetical protein